MHVTAQCRMLELRVRAQAQPVAVQRGLPGNTTQQALFIALLSARAGVQAAPAIGGGAAAKAAGVAAPLRRARCSG